MQIDITKKGNAVGFTSRGETVCGSFLNKCKAWHIGVVSVSGTEMMTDDRNKNFANKADAVAYAQTLIDVEATKRLAWWM